MSISVVSNSQTNTQTNVRLFPPCMLPNVFAAATIIATQMVSPSWTEKTPLFEYDRMSSAPKVSYELGASYRSGRYLELADIPSESEQIKALALFAHKIADSSMSIDPEIGAFINDHFWDLI